MMMIFSGSRPFSLSLSEDKLHSQFPVCVVSVSRVLFLDVELLSVLMFDLEHSALVWDE
jgi:hypothetical protein